MFTYVSEHKYLFNPYSLDQYLEDFSVTDEILNDFLVFAYQKGVEPQPEQLKRIEGDIKHFLKARMARHLFGDRGFYEVWNQKDRVVQRALDALELENPLRLQAEK